MGILAIIVLAVVLYIVVKVAFRIATTVFREPIRKMKAKMAYNKAMRIIGSKRA